MAGVEEERGYSVLWGDMSERIHLEELGIDKMNLLKLNFKKQNIAEK